MLSFSHVTWTCYQNSILTPGLDTKHVSLSSHVHVHWMTRDIKLYRKLSADVRDHGILISIFLKLCSQTKWMHIWQVCFFVFFSQFIPGMNDRRKELQERREWIRITRERDGGQITSPLLSSPLDLICFLFAFSSNFHTCFTTQNTGWIHDYYEQENGNRNESTKHELEYSMQNNKYWLLNGYDQSETRM